MDQFEEIQDKNKKIISSVTVVAAIIVSLVAIVGGGSLYMARSSVLEAKKINVDDAKKIGNWEFPDTDYALIKASKEIVYGTSLNAIEIKDNKSGNNISLLEMPADFENKYMIKNFGSNTDKYGNVIDEDYDFLERYIKNNYDEKGIKIVLLGNTEAYYSLIETRSYKILEKKIEGMNGILRCEGNNSSVAFLIANSKGSFDNERGLKFLKTLNCPEGDAITGNGKKIKLTRTDLDEDGVPDVVEEEIGTDSVAEDTDGDGYSDLGEIKSGYSPLVAGAAGKLLPEEFSMLKQKIKSADVEFYNEIFAQ